MTEVFYLKSRKPRNIFFLYIIKYLTISNIENIILLTMAKLNVSQAADRVQAKPVNIGDRAIDNLAFIRETMERSTYFTAVPGYGGMLMGVTALAAAYIAAQQDYQIGWLRVWLVEAAFAFSVGILAMWQKAKLAGGPLISTPAKKFARGFAPPLIVGIAITLGLWRYGSYEVMAPVWMLCYGAAVVCGGAYSVKVVPIMGWCFITLGAAAFALPAIYGNWLLAVSFGLAHVAFGAVIGRRYGG